MLTLANRLSETFSSSLNDKTFVRFHFFFFTSSHLRKMAAACTQWTGADLRTYGATWRCDVLYNNHDQTSSGPMSDAVFAHTD